MIRRTITRCGAGLDRRPRRCRSRLSIAVRRLASRRRRRRAASTAEFFEARVRPVLAANCYDCHADERMAACALDSREALLKGGESAGDRAGRSRQEPADRGRPADRRALKMPKGGRLQAATRSTRSSSGSGGRAVARLRGTSAARLGALRWVKPAPRRLDSRVRHHAGAARVLVVPADCTRRRCRRSSHGDVAEDRHRSLRAGAARARGPRAGARRRQAHADPPRHARSDRPAADARGDRGVRERRVARRVREGRRSAAGVAALRRSVGPALARRRALRRGRLPHRSIRSGAATTRIRTPTCIATG